MCSISTKENTKIDIRGIGCWDGVSERLISNTHPISNYSNCYRFYCQDFKEEEKIKTITQEEDNLLHSNYLDEKIFKSITPVLEETLVQASKWNALRVQKCRFNGLDYIAQILWNRNPRRSKIFSPPLDVFDIPPFKEYLRQRSRPYYPKSWLWSNEEAALHVQRYVRGWLVRKRANVQEMRLFWKDIAAKNIFNKKKNCIVESQRIIGKIQDDTEHEITDEDLVRCEKYRSMIYTQKRIRKLRENSTF